MVATFVLSASKNGKRLASRTTSFIRGVQSVALFGALAMPFVSWFEGSLIKGLGASVFVGIAFYFLMGLAFRSDVFLSDNNDEEALHPLSLRDANLPGHDEED